MIIYRILARLLLIPFSESDEETTSQLFQFKSAKERISQKTSQLLPFILGMDKYFRDRIYEVDEKACRSTSSAYAAVKVTSLLMPFTSFLFFIT